MSLTKDQISDLRVLFTRVIQAEVAKRMAEWNIGEAQSKLDSFLYDLTQPDPPAAPESEPELHLPLPTPEHNVPLPTRWQNPKK